MVPQNEGECQTGDIASEEREMGEEISLQTFARLLLSVGQRFKQWFEQRFDKRFEHRLRRCYRFFASTIQPLKPT